MTAGRDPKRWIRSSVLQSEPYYVPDSSGLIKLDAMENPHACPESLKTQWLESLHRLEVNRYPDPHAATLKQSLRRVFSIPEDMDVLLGNGSDEIIQIIALTMGGSGNVVLAPEPGFVMYRLIAEPAGLKYVGVQLKEPDFALDGEAMLAAIEEHEPAIVFIAWPNNPTGNLFDRAVVGEIVRAAPGIVVIDEAYHAFARDTFLPMAREHDHLLVMRTLSKLGLAGLRLGFLCGHPKWLREFEKLRLPYNIGILSQASIEFFLDHIDVLDEQAQRIARDRDGLAQRLAALPGFRVWPSAANFILVRSERKPAAAIHAHLRDSGVLVKSLHGVHPLLAQCLRVTVGTAGENEALIEALTAAAS